MPQNAMPQKKYQRGPDVDLEQEDIRDSKGNRIDDQYVAEAVENVHRYLGAGRPSLSAPGTRSPQVAFRVPEAMRAAAQARASREGKTVSALAREAFELYLQTVPKPSRSVSKPASATAKVIGGSENAARTTAPRRRR